MAHIQVDIYGKRLGLAAVMKKIRPLFNLDKVNLSGKVVRSPVSRAERLEEAKSMLDDAKSIIEELRDEIEQWKTGMEGTNLENTQKYQDLEECYSTLDDAVSNLENMELDSISFPGMF